jgi:hypothetical protein
MKKIIIIIPYFGKFPVHYVFWRQSALNNPDIQFLLITDIDYVRSEKNIEVVKMSFEEQKSLIQSNFDFPISLHSPYKLCDYRGAYGIIFQSWIRDVDFWGFGDLDLIYGDIRHFISNEILDNFDVISGWGHLTLYRNNDFCNHFFEKKFEGYQYYKDVFQNPKNCGFDEYYHRGLSDMWKSFYPQKICMFTPFDDIIIPSQSLNFKSYLKPIESNHLIFLYESKNLYRIYINNNQIIKEKILYVHFHRRNNMSINISNYNEYLVIPDSFIEKEDLSLDKLVIWTDEHKYRLLLKNILNSLKCKIKRIW